MAQLKFSVSGHVQLSRNLRVLADDIGDLKSFNQDAVNIVQERSNEIFKNQGKDIEKGAKWKPLSPTTEKMRRDRVGHYKKAPNKPGINRWTGRLQSDITKKATDKYGQFAYNAPYAKEVHEGNKAEKRPPRPIIDINKKTIDSLTKALQKKINDSIGIYGRQI